MPVRLEICYSMIATVTDYDVWNEQDVTIEVIIENAMKSEAAIKDIIIGSLDKMSIE